MRVLNLSLDQLVLESQSAVAGRVREYGELVDKYFVIVPSSAKVEQKLSEHVQVFASGGANKILQLFKTCLLARKLIKKEKFDIVTVQDQYYLALVAWRLAWGLKLPFELQIHGLEKFTGLRKLIAKFVIPRAQVIRVVSARLKKRIVLEFGVQEDKIMVVPIYSELRIKNEEVRIRKEKDKFVFLTVGRLVAIKNIEMQIEVFKELVRNNKMLELWIVGEGSEKEKLKEIAHGIEQIKFFTWQDDLEKFYSKANAYLLTSNYEGWGLVIIEAASYGLPIIMTDVGCAGEVIKDGESGFVIPVGDKEKLKEAMEALIHKPDLGKILGRKAQAAIRKLPTKQETMELYKKNWQKAIEIKKAR
jgi:glycosyltransferase involved in cell wall biosynthesis